MSKECLLSLPDGQYNDGCETRAAGFCAFKDCEIAPLGRDQPLENNTKNGFFGGRGSLN